jgi:hypothetical protein
LDFKYRRQPPEEQFPLDQAENMRVKFVFHEEMTGVISINPSGPGGTGPRDSFTHLIWRNDVPS